MTTYTAHFHNDAEFAFRDFKAETPTEALALARAHQVSKLSLTSYAGLGLPMKQIVILDAEGEEVAGWRDEETSLRDAARYMLFALEQALDALKSQPRFSVPSRESDSYEIADSCARAIALAKGDAS